MRMRVPPAEITSKAAWPSQCTVTGECFAALAPWAASGVAATVAAKATASGAAHAREHDGRKGHAHFTGSGDVDQSDFAFSPASSDGMNPPKLPLLITRTTSPGSA